MTAIMITLAVLFISACTPESNDNGVAVITITPSEVTTTTALCGAEVIVSDGTVLSKLGVCWSTQENPTASDAHLSTIMWEEPFTCTITDLEPNTEYHVRAYALCNQEYYYGADESFTTKDNCIGSLNGHDYIDLDLPSGTLWATCNVGAATSQGYGYGYHFAWGETTTKYSYSWSNYQYCHGSYTRLTKYCTLPGYAEVGPIDNLTVLQPCDDAATANWGAGWRTPSYDEWQELYDYTTNINTTQNGVHGRLFSSENGKSIFLPSDGFWLDGNLYDGDYNGIWYWSSSLNISNPPFAWCLIFKLGSCEMHMCQRNYGLSIRPVCSK